MFGSSAYLVGGVCCWLLVVREGRECWGLFYAEKAGWDLFFSWALRLVIHAPSGRARCPWFGVGCCTQHGVAANGGDCFVQRGVGEVSGEGGWLAGLGLWAGPDTIYGRHRAWRLGTGGGVQQGRRPGGWLPILFSVEKTVEEDFHDHRWSLRKTILSVPP